MLCALPTETTFTPWIRPILESNALLSKTISSSTWVLSVSAFHLMCCVKWLMHRSRGCSEAVGPCWSNLKCEPHGTSSRPIHSVWCRGSPGNHRWVESASPREIFQPSFSSTRASSCSFPNPLTVYSADSHAHILEYGFTRLLPMEGTKTATGKLRKVSFLRDG